jgi:hypothetical protein
MSAKSHAWLLLIGIAAVAMQLLPLRSVPASSAI